MKIVKVMALLTVGLCVAGNAWADNEIGRSCFDKYKTQSKCNGDSKCAWSRDPDRCLAKCGILAQPVCAKEKKSCSVAPGNRCAQK